MMRTASLRKVSHWRMPPILSLVQPLVKRPNILAVPETIMSIVMPLPVDPETRPQPWRRTSNVSPLVSAVAS